MKYLKVMSITFLVFLLLLTGCSIRAEQNEETEETDWEEIFPFEDFAETETNTAQANETISLSHSDSIFNAKFEGDKVAGKGDIVSMQAGQTEKRGTSSWSAITRRLQAVIIS